MIFKKHKNCQYKIQDLIGESVPLGDDNRFYFMVLFEEFSNIEHLTFHYIKTKDGYCKLICIDEDGELFEM